MELDEFEMGEIYREDTRILSTDIILTATTVMFRAHLRSGFIEDTISDTAHLFEVHGEWRWMWSGGDAGANGACPI